MKIPASLYWRTRFMQAFKGLYKSFGDLETWLLKSELKNIEIQKPIYISSLARSGTTIITEMFSQLDNVCSHTYGDFPGVFTPYWNNWLQQKKKFLRESKSERAHADRILINNNSPEAFEEVLWRYFFPKLQYDKFQDIDFFENKEFADYYKQHIKKHLLIKNKSRYIAKANYNISRIKPILKIFPDAKFIIPIRHPVNHIASLMKQHEIYLNAAKNNSQIDRQLAASGHFEFGNLRKIVQIGKIQYAQNVKHLWQSKDEIKGWATYWLGLYNAVLELQKHLPNSIKFVKYEDLCNNSDAKIVEIFNFCQLQSNNVERIKETFSAKLSLPKYYKIPFNQDEINQILNITQTVSSNFGYNAENLN